MIRTLICKTCDTERGLEYFIKSKIGEKFYYSTKRCKVCKSKSGRVNIRSLEKQKNINNVRLSKDCKDYLERLKRRNGWVSELDFFLIAHHYINIFGYSETCYNSVIEEILVMYDQLKKINKNEI